MIENDFVYMDIFALDLKIRQKLHLTDEELNFTADDMYLITTSDYVDMENLKLLVNKAGFKMNTHLSDELGISKTMFSMVFSENTKNTRGLRMRTVIAILNAIRNRGITDSFEKILVKKND